MDPAKIKDRIEAAWNVLPTAFSMHDVLGTLRISKDNCRLIRNVLGAMVDEGRLFLATPPGGYGQGRPATVWSKDPRDSNHDSAVSSAVRNVLVQLPSRFAVADVLAKLGRSRFLWAQVRDVLARLEAEGVIVRLTDVHVAHRGRKPVLWSADPAVIAGELSFRQRLAAIQSGGYDSTQERASRLFSGWDPFGEKQRTG